MRRFAMMLVLGLPLAGQAQEVAQGAPNADFAPAFAQQTRAAAMAETPIEMTLVAGGLVNPWGIAPWGVDEWLVTERPGRMRVVAADGNLSAPIAGLPDVAAERQGGLLDVAVGADGLVYWTYATVKDGGFITAAARGALVEADGGYRMQDVEVLFEQTPPSGYPMHYGARIVPDGEYIWITTGEHSHISERRRAQDVNTTYGKVIRLFADGQVPPDNPFVGREGDDAIWSLGHRNIQGAALDPVTGALWTIEHGPRGGDELNLPGAGLNYGWPIVSYGVNYDGSDVGQGAARGPGFEEPVYYWDPVIAPGGMAFYSGDVFDWEGDLLIGSLNPGALVRLRLEDGLVVGEERLLTNLGRIRDVELDRDGSVLVLVDAQDGGIVRVRPAN